MDAPEANGHTGDSYQRGYADGLHDMARVLLNETVARAARLVDTDALATELGAAIAHGEHRAFDWPTPANGKDH